jgi:hypothetical protein
MLATKLGATDRFAQRTQIEGRPQPRRERVRGIVSHECIIGLGGLYGTGLSADLRARLL